MTRTAATMCVLAVIGASASGADIQVTRQLWGFGGRAVGGRLNLLSLEVVNVGTEPYDGELRLRCTDVVGRTIGAPIAERCFLSPGARRWVQFVPFVLSAYEEWAVQWGRSSAERMKLKPPTLDLPARVLLDDPSDPVSGASGFPRLPERLFPTTVAATDGCHSLVLDHVPRWGAARARAFLDWLRCGGQLHILLGRHGRYPSFTGDLAVLNNPRRRFRVGAGVVVRHRLPRADVTEATLARRGYPKPAAKEKQDFLSIDGADVYFRALGRMTRPKHSWGLIYLVTLIYIVFIGPVHYNFGRGRRDYRRTLLYFLLTVAACAAVLGFLGQRGTDEATAAHSIAYARHIEGAEYDTSQWVNVFVTRGGTYALTHGAMHSVYAACRGTEAVDGAIRNGRDGRFEVDIPLNSARPFLHRARLAGPDMDLKAPRVNGRSTELAVEATGTLPADILDMWLVSEDTVFSLFELGGVLMTRSSAKWTREQFVQQNLEESYGPGDYDYGQGKMSARDVEQSFRRLGLTLAARVLAGDEGRAGAADDLQVFIYARAPESFRLQDRRLSRGDAYVLYHFRFPAQE